MLFMQTGKIDVWNKIKARQAEMDLADAKEISALKKAEKEAKEKAAATPSNPAKETPDDGTIPGA